MRPPAVVVGAGWGPASPRFGRSGRAGLRVLAVDDREESERLADTREVHTGCEIRDSRNVDAAGGCGMNGDGKRWAITFSRRALPLPQRPPYVDAMWTHDDPRPVFVHFARVVRP